jgi:hypothetical protein
MGEWLHDLESPTDPSLADLKRLSANQALSIQLDLTLIGGIDAGEKVEDCGLAGSIGTNQADNLPARNLEADILNGRQTPKMFGYTTYLKKSHISPSESEFGLRMYY